MIESADYLCEKHFGRNLIDKDVEILDPAAGTGTFICELIEHFRGQPREAQAQVPRGAARQRGRDPALLRRQPEHRGDLRRDHRRVSWSSRTSASSTRSTTRRACASTAGTWTTCSARVSDENVERITRQNSRKISVIIGNPPYNANQLNENENNKNREYPEIDKRIKETYIKESTAQKTKLYDMYARFFRWASDRLDENGIVAFITNRSFIESRTFDGFRKVVGRRVQRDPTSSTSAATSAPTRSSPARSTTSSASRPASRSASWLSARRQKGCRIFYARRPELETAEEKLDVSGRGEDCKTSISTRFAQTQSTTGSISHRTTLILFCRLLQRRRKR